MNITKHENSNKGNSPALGGIAASGFPVFEASQGIDKGTYVFEGFEHASPTAATGAAGGLHYLIDSSSSIDVQDKPGGVIRLTTASGDNNAICTGSGASGFCEIDGTVAKRKRFFFEARLKTSAIAATDLFVGVVVPRTSALISSSGTLASGKFVGFHLTKDGVLKSKVSDASTTTALTLTPSVVNDTYVKFLIQFDEGPADSGQLTFAVNGEKVAVYADVNNALTELGSGGALKDSPLAGVVEVLGDAGTVNVDIDHIAIGYAGGDV